MAVYSVNGDGKLVRSFYSTSNFHSTTKFSHMTNIDHSVVRENEIAMDILDQSGLFHYWARHCCQNQRSLSKKEKIKMQRRIGFHLLNICKHLCLKSTLDSPFESKSPTDKNSSIWMLCKPFTIRPAPVPPATSPISHPMLVPIKLQHVAFLCLGISHFSCKT